MLTVLNSCPFLKMLLADGLPQRGTGKQSRANQRAQAPPCVPSPTADAVDSCAPPYGRFHTSTPTRGAAVESNTRDASSTMVPTAPFGVIPRASTTNRVCASACYCQTCSTIMAATIAVPSRPARKTRGWGRLCPLACATPAASPSAAVRPPPPNGGCPPGHWAACLPAPSLSRAATTCLQSTQLCLFHQLTSIRTPGARHPVTKAVHPRLAL
jgi:hypothetical protein